VTGPASPRPRRSTDVVVALDVGGTGMKCALVRPDGSTVHTERHPTGAGRGPDAVVATILDVAEGLTARARNDGLTPLSVGIAIPGVIDEATGAVVWSANLGFRDVPLRERVGARLGLPTALGHDVRLGGLAEARLGAGRGTRHLLFVAVGTGIAAAHVVDGTVLAGAHGAAGELGHVVIRPGGPRCGCGARGCLEAVASAAAVGRRYTALTGTAATAAEVADRVVGGEEAARQVWRETIDALADGLILAQTLYDAEVVVLGGGLAEAGAVLLDPLGETLRQRLTFQTEPRLRRAALGDAAGCLGAALLALDTVEAQKAP
jgi:Transcriptional regulator/sugar kinase